MPNILVYLACLFWTASAWAETDRGVPVKAAQTQQQEIYQRIPLTGTVTAARVARISVEVSGLVDNIFVEEGSRVAKGDPLLSLDNNLVKLQSASASAKANQLRWAWQDAKRRLKEAKALARNIAESTVRDIESEIAQDEALLQQAQAELGYQQALLKRHQVVAPFAGVIYAKTAERGEWVVPGQSVLELVSLDRPRIDFKLAEDYLQVMGPNASIEYYFSAYPGQRYQSNVGTVVPVSDPLARTFLIRVPIENHQDKVIPGLSVSAEMKVPTGRTGVVVSRDAILRTPDGRTVVWLPEKENDGFVVRETTVVTGVQSDGMIEIVEGLTPGLDVVVKGNEALQRGQRVYLTHD